MVSVPFAPGEPPVVGTPKRLFRATLATPSFVVTPDGETVILIEETELKAKSPIGVTLGWQVLLDKKAER